MGEVHPCGWAFKAQILLPFPACSLLVLIAKDMSSQLLVPAAVPATCRHADCSIPDSKLPECKQKQALSSLSCLSYGVFSEQQKSN